MEVPRSPGVYFVDGSPAVSSDAGSLSEAPLLPLLGMCQGCGEVQERLAMAAHLDDCPEALGSDAVPGHSVLVEVQATFEPEYWLMLQLDAAMHLDALDRTLRRLWLGCCGHRSELVVGGPRHASSVPPEPGGGDAQRSMQGEALVDVATGSVPLDYVYEAEEATQLMLRVPRHLPTATPDGIRLLARNVAPEFPCLCGAAARFVCPRCRWASNGWLCTVCEPFHQCGVSPQPICNSPRVGLCHPSLHPPSSGVQLAIDLS